MNETKICNNELLELIRLASGGNVNAFKMIVDKTSRFAFGIAYRTLLNHESAKDVVQESFIRVWKHLDEYKAEIKFTTWLYKIVMNLCYDKIKSDKRKKLLLQNYSGDIEYQSVGLNNMENDISNIDAVNLVMKLSRELSQKQRTVFILRDLNGLNVEEVAKVMNISTGAVKSNLFYARKFISTKFNTLENKKDLK